MKCIGCKIRIMKWKRAEGKRAWIFANSSSFYGRLILRLRGYKPHEIHYPFHTVTSTVLRKEL
jgi:hypothetical protein